MRPGTADAHCDANRGGERMNVAVTNLSLWAQGGRAGGMPPDVPSHGWTQHTAPDGHLYYFNVMTGTSQWERPLELDFPMSGKGR